MATSTPTNDLTLQIVGNQLLGRFYLIIPVNVLQGIFLLLFAASTFGLLQRGFKTNASQILFLGMLLNFGLGTAQWVGLVTGAILETRTLLVEHLDLSMEQKIVIYDAAIMKLQTPLSMLEAVPMIISDAIVIWRAWALFPTQRWIMAFPVAFVLGSLGTWIAVAANAHNTDVMITVNGFLAYLSLSLAANVSATVLIGWKLWTYRELLSTDLGLKPRRSPALQILVTVVESGLIFAVFQIGFLVLQTPSVIDSTIKRSEINAENVLNVAFIMLSAFYPSIVALVVNAQSSYISTVDFGTDIRPPFHDEKPLTAILFASPPSTAKMGQNSQ